VLTKSVLIVDDAMFMRLSLKIMLEKNGFQVIGEAENGAVAVEQYKKLNPDIENHFFLTLFLDSIA